MSREFSWLDYVDGVDSLETLQGWRADLIALRDSRGRKVLEGVLNGRYNLLAANMVLSPLSSMDQVLAQEYVKGQAAECQVQSNLLEDLISEFTSRIDHLKEVQSYE